MNSFKLSSYLVRTTYYKRINEIYFAYASETDYASRYIVNMIERVSDTTLDDYLSVLREVELNADSEPSKGFIFQTQLREIQSVVKNGVGLRFLKEDKTLGIISGFNKDSPLFSDFARDAAAVAWTASNPLNSPKVAYIYQIAVRTTARNSKVAISLWNAFKAHFPEHVFIAAIIENPISNLRSRDVLLASGFERVGQFNAVEFKGLKDYQSGVYVRTI